jgi:hypothetical protein
MRDSQIRFDQGRRHRILNLVEIISIIFLIFEAASISIQEMCWIRPKNSVLRRVFNQLLLTMLQAHLASVFRHRIPARCCAVERK